MPITGMYSETVETSLKFFSLSGLAPEKIGELKDAFAKSGYKGFLQSRIEQLKS